MGISLIEILQTTGVYVIVGLLFIWLFVGGYYLPMMIRVLLKGGHISVRYNVPHSAYVEDLVFRQPDQYKPITLNPNYIMACIKENDQSYTVGVIDGTTNKMTQVIYNGFMDHRAAEYLAKTYSYNYGIPYKKYYNNLEKRQIT